MSWRAQPTMLLFLLTMVLAISTLVLTPPHSRVTYADDGRARGGKSGELIPGDDVSPPISTVAGRSQRQIRLDLYIVFHQRLYDHLYVDLHAPLLPPRPPDTAVQVSAVASAEGTAISFVATNPTLNKTINASNPLYVGRIEEEWALPGYSPTLGFKFNEYGAMASVHLSNRSELQKREANSSVNAVQPWIGFLQYDMRLDSVLIDKVRRAIVVADAAKLSSGERRKRLKRAVSQPTLKCCIFSGVVYYTQFLLFNAMGQLLVQRYNEHFASKCALEDLPQMATLDMFIVPNELFNRMMPFLERLMEDLAKRSVRFPDPTVPLAALQSGPNATTGRWRAARPLVVMEAALAVALGCASDFKQVLIPMRHDRQADMGGQGDE